MALDAAIDPGATRDALYSVVGSFTRDALLYGDERRRLKEKCEGRLSCAMPWKRQVSGGGGEKGEAIEYAEQAILADLDWGIGALEEALCASSIDTKNAWLEHAEKMLQVCVLLDTEDATAGIPNSYLAAWANLYLAFVWKLRNDDTNSLKHVLDMFLVDPLYSRLDFAPKLWEHLFLPHLTSVVAWFDEQREHITSSQSSTQDQAVNTPEQEACWLQNIEELYENTFDNYTRLYARYYTECLNFDAGKRRSIPLIPIAEPPATPLYDPSSICSFSGEIQEDEDAASTCHLQFKSPTESCIIHQPARYDFRSSGVELIQEKLECTQETLLTDGTDRADETSSSKDKQWNPAAEASSPPSLATMVQVFATRLILKDKNGDKFTGERPKRLIDFLQETMQGPSGLLKMSELDHYENSGHPQKGDFARDLGQNFNLSHQRITLQRRSYITKSKLSFESVEACNEDRLPKPFEEFELQNHFINKNDSSIVTPFQQKAMNLIICSDEQPSNWPPLKFISPSTGQLLDESSKLETGQTYECWDVQEWLDSPLNQSQLHKNVLSKTDFVLKKSIARFTASKPDNTAECSSDIFTHHHCISCSEWFASNHQESRPLEIQSGSGFILNGFSCNSMNEELCERRGGCKRYIKIHSKSHSSSSEVTFPSNLMSDLKLWIVSLCTSDNLEECESVIMKMIARWSEIKLDKKAMTLLQKPGFIDGMIEILFASTSKTQRMVLYILSELMNRNQFVLQTLINIDPEQEEIVGFVKKGFPEAVVVLCQIRPHISILNSHYLLRPLINIISQIDQQIFFEMPLHPKLAALKLLEVVLDRRQDPNVRASNVHALISFEGVNTIVKCLCENSLELRMHAATILLNCMKDFKNFSELFVELSASSLADLIELFSTNNSEDKATAICLLVKLLHPSRFILD